MDKKIEVAKKQILHSIPLGFIAVAVIIYIIKRDIFLSLLFATIMAFGALLAYFIKGSKIENRTWILAVIASLILGLGPAGFLVKIAKYFGIETTWLLVLFCYLIGVSVLGLFFYLMHKLGKRYR